MSKNRLQNYIKTRKWRGGETISSVTTEYAITRISTKIHNKEGDLDLVDSSLKNIVKYTEINDWVVKKTTLMPHKTNPEIKRFLTVDEKQLKDTDNNYAVINTSGNRNDCLIHAFLTGVSPIFRQLSETDKNTIASYFRRVVLLWLVLNEPVNTQTPTITQMQKELMGDIALKDDVIDYLAGKFKII